MTKTRVMVSFNLASLQLTCGLRRVSGVDERTRRRVCVAMFFRR
jgi:hypothetical protein